MGLVLVAGHPEGDYKSSCLYINSILVCSSACRPAHMRNQAVTGVLEGKVRKARLLVAAKTTNCKAYRWQQLHVVFFSLL